MFINFKCTNCGADVVVEEGKETVFCEACGTKLILTNMKPVAPTVPSEPVPVNNETVSVLDSLYGAVAALDAGEYEAAFQAFTAVAESGSNEWAAKLYAGFASAAMSKPGNLRISDGLTAAKNAAASDYDGADKPAVLTDFAERVKKFAKDITLTYYSHDKDFVYADANAAKDHFDATSKLVEYLEACSDLFTRETMRKTPELEAVKKGLINELIDYIGFAGKPVEYLVGYKCVVKPNNIIATARVEEKMNCPFGQQYKNIAEKGKNAFNTVPSTINRVKKIEDDIEANRKVVEDYKKSLEDYLASNPEDAKVYKRWRIFTSKKSIEDIEARFPQALKDKKAASEKSEALISNLAEERKKFLKDNTI
ncbi:MAG: zinc ribbon domain-containing protein [Clostridia bacterium]|nr:zinc ribbon domain-containing protein [Clostridia bacterium]